MCGIAGFIGFENNRQLAEQANKTQKHRGPDNQSVWYDDFVALAHQRLSIIDLSENANQPFEKYNFVIVFNGEIYNYKELKKKLSYTKNVFYKSTSDTEVILEYFIEYGVKCLDFFEGMFAIAIYNKQNHELFLARDHFGIKPVFYTQIAGNIAFSSELKTLVKIPEFNKSINFRSLISSLNYLWVSGNETMFQDCFKLPPAHYALIDVNKKIEIKKYWELKDKTFEYSNEKDLIKKLNEETLATISKHMIADVPVSAFLSGGLDSSLISILASKHNPKISTYTIGTDDKDKKIEQMPDDEKYARQLADKEKFDHHEIIIKPDILNILPQIVKTLDEPIGDPAAINTWLICKAARKKGVKVLLSGMGADELFFGYRRQKATMLAIKYRKIPKLVRMSIEFIGKNLPVKIGGRGIKTFRWAKRFLSFASLPLEKSYMRSYSYYNSTELKTLMNSKYNNEIKAIYKEHEKIFNSKYNNDTINQICNTDINMFMYGLNLTYTDRASMMASVEVRVPYIDRHYIEFVMSIPGKYKFKKNIQKYILKKVSEKYLPLDIIYRPKASFGAPIRSWISNDLRPLVDDLLSKKNVEKRDIFNYKMIKKIIDNDRTGKEDNAYRIYQLLTIELWFREFVDK